MMTEKSNDYRFVVFLKNGEKRCGWYQDIVRTLGLEGECFLNQPLVGANPNHSFYVACALKKEFPQIERVVIYEDDNEIITLGVKPL